MKYIEVFTDPPTKRYGSTFWLDYYLGQFPPDTEYDEYNVIDGKLVQVGRLGKRTPSTTEKQCRTCFKLYQDKTLHFNKAHGDLDHKCIHCMRRHRETKAKS